MAETLLPGQRWISRTEPELGLGLVLQTEQGRVSMLFPATDEVRLYAEGAPIKRVRFSEGDRIEDKEGKPLTVDEVEDREGLLVYHGNGVELLESELSDSISFSKPQDRMSAGQMDSRQAFELRYEALKYHFLCLKSPVRGLLGARIDLIPHQLYVAGEVANRQEPRVLLADEVGLGKTIEAGLIIHRLALTGRASRVLVVVPEPLINQWFVEMLRRFNMQFAIYDEDRCRAIESNNPDTNPFLDDQLVICSIDFLAGNPQRSQQAVEAGWDILVVDEAHHLKWAPDAVSAEYAAVELLAKVAPGVLLLTATPEQLGREGHFARLRLLDPDRYFNLDDFLKEGDHYEEVAEVADALISGDPFSPKAEDTVKMIFKGHEDSRIQEMLLKIRENDTKARNRLLKELLDQHGTGRVMFRNMRTAMQGFPERKGWPVPIQGAFEDAVNLKVKWLAEFLRNHPDETKVLLICKTQELVLEIEDKIKSEVNVNTGVFHEGLTLIQRDRNAAWFSEADGARLLICSEIGSEGRNFQFAHHLVLFDLPEDPALLEQRIGRLDRIGQTETINVHIPYMEGSSEEVWLQWYHQGINAIEHSVHGAQAFMDAFGEEVRALAARETRQPSEIGELISKTKEMHADLSKRLEKGRDHLLELNSFQEKPADLLRTKIRAIDEDRELDEYLIRILDHFGVTVETLKGRTHLLKPERLFTDALPGLKDEGTTVSFSREESLSREDIEFMTWDHPLVLGALDTLLGSEQGNCCFALMDEDGGKALFLEAVFLIECMAPKCLHVDRFLPPTPVRLLLNHHCEDLTEHFNFGDLAGRLRDGPRNWMQKNSQTLQGILPKMLKEARRIVDEKCEDIQAEAEKDMKRVVGAEVRRLQTLKEVNDHIRDSEIELAKSQQASIRKHLQGARVRLDSMRLIFRD